MFHLPQDIICHIYSFDSTYYDIFPAALRAVETAYFEKIISAIYHEPALYKPPPEQTWYNIPPGYHFVNNVLRKLARDKLVDAVDAQYYYTEIERLSQYLHNCEQCQSCNACTDHIKNGDVVPAFWADMADFEEDSCTCYCHELGDDVVDAFKQVARGYLQAEIPGLEVGNVLVLTDDDDYDDDPYNYNDTDEDEYVGIISFEFPCENSYCCLSSIS